MKTFNGSKGAGMLAVFLIGVLVGRADANASLLDPGDTIALRPAHEPKHGHLLAVTYFKFENSSFSGKLTSKVWADDESNPWGGLTFSYRLVNTGKCADPLGWFTLSGFGGLLVDVNYSYSGGGGGAPRCYCCGGVAPRRATRSELGETVSFGFFNCAGGETLHSGSSSAWLVIQTSGNTWGINQLVGLDAEMVAATTFTPVAVPEPASVTIMALASLVLLARQRR